MAKLPTYEEMGKKVAEKALDEIYGGKTIREWIEILVKQQPFVIPQPKTGEWIDDHCSECGKGIEDLIDSPEWYENERPNFCPFCGTPISEGPGMKMRIWEDIDKEEISKAVVLLDLFTKTFCRYRNDYERFDDLRFRCDECPFQKENGDCLAKVFKNKYAPDYRDFGSMGDL